MRVLFQYYIPLKLFFFASFGVFIVTTSLFIFDRKPSDKLLWNDFICFLPNSTALFTFTVYSTIWPVYILQRFVKIWDSIWSRWMHGMRKSFNLVRWTWSFLILAMFSSLCFVMFGSSLFLNSSTFCITSLHLCRLFAHISMVLAFPVFIIFPAGPLPNYICVVSIIVSDHVIIISIIMSDHNFDIVKRSQSPYFN